jgi:hypothetical protein
MAMHLVKQLLAVSYELSAIITGSLGDVPAKNPIALAEG